MADSRAPGGKKGAAPVEVIHFPKRGGPDRAKRTLEDLREARLALPDGSSESGASDSAWVSPSVAGVGRRRRSESGKKGKETRGEASPRSGRRRRANPPEPAPDASVRQKAHQIQELLARPADAQGPVSRTQIAEMSLFGHHLFERGQLDEARAVFEKIVGLGVEEAFPHTMLGTIYLASGSPDRALALFEAALALDDTDLAARVYRAEIRLNAGRIDEATEDLDQAIEQGLAEDPFVDRAKRLKQMAEERARRQRR